MHIFYHHNEWECWKNGLYSKRPIDLAKVSAAKRLLATPSVFKLACLSVSATFKKSCLHHLSAMNNANPWMGQAACFLMLGCTEEETRKAWGLLERESQLAANRVAFKVFNQSVPYRQLKLF